MSNPITVLIHLTGLLVVVPPKGSGDTTHIVMAEPTGIPAHVGRIGFEGRNVAGLCKEYEKGICYVDMSIWSLDPVGAGGTIPMPTIKELPSSLINLTHGSGNQHRVDTSTLGSRAIARFLSGRPAKDSGSCSLADWRYQPFGAASPHEVPLANVVSWQMDLPRSNLELVFRRITDPSVTEIVPLDPSGDTVEIAVAYLPKGDFDRLARGIPQTPQEHSPDTPAEHFDALYNPLGIGQSRDRRPIPRFVRQTRSQACPISIRTRLKAPFIPEARAAIDTHSCMLAAAEAK